MRSPVLFIALLIGLSTVYSIRSDQISEHVTLTFYGYPDNCDEDGCWCKDSRCYTMHHCQNPTGEQRGQIPGGDGSWDNPISIAAGENVWPFETCAVVYLPYLKKYGIIDDVCANCGPKHLDIWVNSDKSDQGADVCSCEVELTPSILQPVLLDVWTDERSQLPIDLTPLYNQATQSCSGKTYFSIKRDDAGQLQSQFLSSTLAGRRPLKRDCYAVAGCACYES